MRDVLKLAQPPLRRFLPGVALGVLSALCAVALLATSAWLITRASEHPPILYLSAAIVGVRAFALGRAGFRYAERLASHDAAFRQLGELRVAIYRRLEVIAPDGLGTTSRGDVMATMVADVERLPDLPLRVVQPLVVAAVVSLVAVVGMWMLLPLAGLALLVFLVVGFALSTVVHGALAARAERAIAPLRGRLADQVLETLSLLDVLVAYDALTDALARIRRTDREMTAATRRRAIAGGATSGILTALAGFAALVGLLLAIPALHGHAIDAPVLAIITLVPLAAFEAIGGAPLAVAVWRQVRASAERVADVTDGEATAGPAIAPASASPVVFSPALQLEGLAASWPRSSTPAVSDVTLELDFGDRMLVTGRTGSGKTTLAHALVGFLPYSGSYRLCGREAADIPADELHALVGLCEQRPYLFDSDLRQNLLLARDTASDAELTRMLERVGLRDWAESRDGLDTMLGDGGSLVSGGQAQRIALARALLADFPIIVFDEPTANVEADLASQLLDDILSATDGDDRIVILVSHVMPRPGRITHTLDLGVALDSEAVR